MHPDVFPRCTTIVHLSEILPRDTSLNADTLYEIDQRVINFVYIPLDDHITWNSLSLLNRQLRPIFNPVRIASYLLARENFLQMRGGALTQSINLGMYPSANQARFTTMLGMLEQASPLCHLPILYSLLSALDKTKWNTDANDDQDFVMNCFDRLLYKVQTLPALAAEKLALFQKLHAIASHKIFASGGRRMALLQAISEAHVASAPVAADPDAGAGIKAEYEALLQAANGVGVQRIAHGNANPRDRSTSGQSQFAACELIKITMAISSPSERARHFKLAMEMITALPLNMREDPCRVMVNFIAALTSQPLEVEKVVRFVLAQTELAGKSCTATLLFSVVALAAMGLSALPPQSRLPLALEMLRVLKTSGQVRLQLLRALAPAVTDLSLPTERLTLAQALNETLVGVLKTHSGSFDHQAVRAVQHASAQVASGAARLDLLAPQLAWLSAATEESVPALYIVDNLVEALSQVAQRDTRIALFNRVCTTKLAPDTSASQMLQVLATLLFGWLGKDHSTDWHFKRNDARKVLLRTDAQNIAELLSDPGPDSKAEMEYRDRYQRYMEASIGTQLAGLIHLFPPAAQLPAFLDLVRYRKWNAGYEGKESSDMFVRHLAASVPLLDSRDARKEARLALQNSIDFEANHNRYSGKQTVGIALEMAMRLDRFPDPQERLELAIELAVSAQALDPKQRQRVLTAINAAAQRLSDEDGVRIWAAISAKLS